MSGKWWLGTRGSNPKPWDPWQWTELEQVGERNMPSLEHLVNMVKWAEQGQHVRLEFVPNGVIDQAPGKE